MPPLLPTPTFLRPFGLSHILPISLLPTFQAALSPSLLQRPNLFQYRTLRIEANAKRVPKLITRHYTFPQELFRVNTGHSNVHLHDFVERRARKILRRGKSPYYDVKVPANGWVQPHTSNYYEGRNGAIMQPNTIMMQNFVKASQRTSWGLTIFRIPAGTPLPPELVLIEEGPSQFSIQCTEPMPLRELNERITTFLRKNGEMMKKAEFLEKFWRVGGEAEPSPFIFRRRGPRAF
ncbi:hypothetical protein HDV00_002930 [Rhizophlyctis rosea]|nr:hypothetical protein HDV00_002930 [Rhizophlyctis rosea]